MSGLSAENAARWYVGWLVLGFLLASAACSTTGSTGGVRPKSVRADAIYIPGINGTAIWQQCSSPKVSGRLRCQIFNGKGEVFRDDDFVPYTGSLPGTRTDVRIVPRGGTEWIELADGTILIPSSQIERVKHYLDLHVRTSPR